MPMRSTRQRDGFSLIELLVTIFIAGIFFSAMVPLFISAQKQNSSDAARILCVTVARDRIEKIRQLDYKEITVANLNDPTFKTPAGQSPIFGPVYSNVIDGTTTRAVYITYDVQDLGQYKIVTVTTNWDDPDTANPEPPLPVYSTVLKTEVYKQFSGPQIIKFDVLENGLPVAEYFTKTQVTLRAYINSGDVVSMDQGNADPDKRGRITFVVKNAAGEDLERYEQTVPVSPTYSNQYEWTWQTATYPDGPYTFVATAYAADHSEGNSWAQTRTFDKGPPVAPTVTAIPGNASVTLTWQCVPEPTDLSRYEVWRSTPGQSNWVQIVPSTMSKTYFDDGLSNGTPYWYRVAAVDIKGQSSLSTAVTATPFLPAPDITGPAAPSGLSAVKGGNNVAAIVLTWTTASVDNPPPTPPSGMTGGHYVVERASNLAFTTGVSTVSSNHPYGNMSFTDATTGYNTTWYYHVAGVDLAGNVGPWSAAVSAKTDPPIYRTLTVTRGGGKYYLWVQSKLFPYLYYSTSGVATVTKPAGVLGNKNSSTAFLNLPSGLYTVIYSTSSTGNDGSKDVDCSSGNGTVTV
jgi:prepilin-type N-terminal cleavage/methylation domain-containing protein